MSLAPSDYKHTHDAQLTLGVSNAVRDAKSDIVTFSLDLIKPARSNQVLTDDARDLMDQLRTSASYRVVTDVGDGEEGFHSIEPTDRQQIKNWKSAKFTNVYGNADFMSQLVHLTRSMRPDGGIPQVITTNIFGASDGVMRDTILDDWGNLSATSGTGSRPVFTPMSNTVAPSIRSFEDDLSSGTLTPPSTPFGDREPPKTGHANLRLTFTPIQYSGDKDTVYRVDSIEEAEQLSVRYNQKRSATLLKQVLTGKTVDVVAEYSADKGTRTGKSALQVLNLEDTDLDNESYNHTVDHRAQTAWRGLKSPKQDSITMEISFEERCNDKDNYTAGTLYNPALGFYRR
ncbi:hypothetical protein I203_103577 [Kwoniella mangroviensis CBS 8507]|uniref:uncharacterized protein n=1 Tax=Kwoniella mangroviensis CBS 8507 TaxID=1296122 RepID=UPI00080D4F23|nr:uncharacterized protein I203_04324 [Kwoniella mangroviensis CBS 8507]OCF66748.1 hypothetical protein I203_04324 [Kwoniella mangroviensis CBS 8507]